jgi:CTD kinase subunit alpha
MHRQPMHQYSPPNQPYRGSSFSSPTGPQGQFYQNHQQHHGHFSGPHGQMQPGFANQQYRGSQQGFRQNQFSPVQDRRFSGPGQQGFPLHAQRGRGHFSNLHWTSNGSRGIGRGQFEQHPNMVNQQGPGPQQFPPQQAPTQQSSFEQSPEDSGDPDDNPFRPSKALQVEDESTAHITQQPEVIQNGVPGEGQKMLPPIGRPIPKGPQDKGSQKFSFAFKTKTPSTKPDLSQRMRESRRESMGSGTGSTSARTKVRGEAPLEPTSKRSSEPEKDVPCKEERRGGEKREGKQELKVFKATLTLPPEFAASDSVYFRKPGNESVVGSGTYGKVFKGIHVYTKQLVALKKIRMEGERDGVSSGDCWPFGYLC